MSRVVVAGHICVDLAPRLTTPVSVEPGALVEVGPLRVTAGGSVFNTGRALAAAGIPIEAYANVGRDVLGGILLDALEREGIGAADVRSNPDVGTSYSVVIEAEGRSRTLWHHLGAVAEFDGTAVDVDDATLVHVGYPPALPGLLADGGAPLVRLLERARAAGATTSVDMSVVDPRSAAAAVDWTALLAEVLPLIDVFTPSVDDLVSMRVTGPQRDEDALHEVAADLVRAGAGVVLVSDGEHGSFLHTGTRSRLDRAGSVLEPLAATWADAALRVAPERVETVVTTNGAGDTSTAGLLYGALTGTDVAEAGRLAAHLAATLIRGQDVGAAVRGRTAEQP